LGDNSSILSEYRSSYFNSQSLNLLQYFLLVLRGSGALGIVDRLRGVSFDWKPDGKHDIGLIAEEVAEVIPEAILYDESGKNARAVDCSRLIAVLIEAVKKQQVQIKNQRGQLGVANWGSVL